MSAPVYRLEDLLAAEARAVAAAAANSAERERARKRTVKVLKLRAAAYRRHAWIYAARQIGEAMDMVAANIWRGRARSMAALLLFERQWGRERAWLRRRGLRVSGYDAVEQFVRQIRLWRVAGVLR